MPPLNEIFVSTNLNVVIVQSSTSGMKLLRALHQNETTRTRTMHGLEQNLQTL